jgi:hypothetical protein
MRRHQVGGGSSLAWFPHIRILAFPAFGVAFLLRLFPGCAADAPMNNLNLRQDILAPDSRFIHGNTRIQKPINISHGAIEGLHINLCYFAIRLLLL